MKEIKKNTGFIFVTVCLTIIFFILICSSAYSLYLPADGDKTITLIAKDELLTNCLKILSSQTNINFVFSNDLIARVKINCYLKNMPLNEALAKILSKKELGYKYITNEQIVIYEVKTSPVQNFIEGIVCDSHTGERLPYTEVSVDGLRINTTATNEGEFVLNGIPQGKCIISTRRIGYTSGKIEINTDTLKNKKLKILMDEFVIMFEPVIINAENIDIFRVSDEPGRFSISALNNSILPYVGVRDISRTLQSVPGISTANFASSGLNIRGGIASQNLVLLDGIPVYHMNHSFGFFNSFNPAVLKDVQVYKGGYPAKFGSRLSGVIELTSKDGDFDNPHIEAGISQTNSQALAEIPLFGKGSVILSARRSISGYILNSLYERISDSFTDIFSVFEPKNQQYSGKETNIYFYDLLTKATFLPTNKDIISVSYFSGFDKFENGKKQNAEKATLNENSTTKDDGVSINWFRKWNSEYSTTALFSSSKYSTDNNKWWENKIITDTILVNNVNTLNNLDEYSFNFDNQLDISQQHCLNFGVYYNKTSTLFNFGLEYLPLFNAEAKRNLDNQNVWLSSFYFQDRWKITDCLTSNIGFRLNKYQSNKTTDFEPRFCLTWQLTPDLTLKSSAGKYYQYIMQFEDFASLLQGRVSWISADNNDVKSSSATHLILGAKYEKEDFVFDAELYLKKLFRIPETLYEWNLYESMPGTNKLIQNNGSVKGIDLLIKKKAGNFFGWISYSYSCAQTQYTVDEVERTVPSSNDAPHKIDVVLNLKRGSFTFSAAWHLISGKPYSIPQVETSDIDGTKFNYYTNPAQYNDHRNPVSHQLDLSVMYSYTNRLFSADCGISIFNLYDKKNVWFSSSVVKNNVLNRLNIYMLGITPTLFFDLRL